jgi:integrase
MSRMVSVRTEELTGPALDWAIKAIEGDQQPEAGQMDLFALPDAEQLITKYGVWVDVGHRHPWLNDSAWKKARVRAAKLWQEENLRPAHPGYLSIRIHDLKHTFGRRLRAAGVTEEDRKALLGHKNGSITSHYSGAELGHLIEAANMVSATDSRGPVLTILKRKQA